MALTDEGHAVLEAARRVETELDALRRTLSGRATEVSGRVRVSCTEPVAMELLGPSLVRLRDDHPGLAVDVVVDAHASDLDRRDADIAIRMFQPRRASLVARRLGSTFTGFFASRAYLERHGVPEVLPDLARHRVIGPDRDPLFVQQAARLGFSTEQMTYRTDAFATVLSWVRQGVAIGALLGCVAQRDPELVMLLEPLVEHPVWLVTHPDLRGSAPVDAVWRRLADDLPEALLAGPW
jgi:DNA-binding transcriptional LysR family regulator